MLKQMLIAVKEMLIPESNTEPIESFRVRVDCARTLLEKVIVGMAVEPSPVTLVAAGTQVQPVKPVPSKREPKEDEIKIVMDKHHQISEVVNAPPDTILILDGVEYTVAQAIGKSFTDGKIK